MAVPEAVYRLHCWTVHCRALLCRELGRGHAKSLWQDVSLAGELCRPSVLRALALSLVIAGAGSLEDRKGETDTCQQQPASGVSGERHLPDRFHTTSLASYDHEASEHICGCSAPPSVAEWRRAYLSDEMLRHGQRGKTDGEHEAMASPQMAGRPDSRNLQQRGFARRCSRVTFSITPVSPVERRQARADCSVRLNSLALV